MIGVGVSMTGEACTTFAWYVRPKASWRVLRLSVKNTLLAVARLWRVRTDPWVSVTGDLQFMTIKIGRKPIPELIWARAWNSGWSERLTKGTIARAALRGVRRERLLRCRGVRLIRGQERQGHAHFEPKNSDQKCWNANFAMSYRTSGNEWQRVGMRGHALNFHSWKRVPTRGNY